MLEIILMYFLAVIFAGIVFYISSIYRRKYLYRNIVPGCGVSMHGRDIDQNLKKYFGSVASPPIKKHSIGSP